MPKNDKEYLEELGKNIRAKRKKLKMSQADLAYKVGMDVPNLSSQSELGFEQRITQFQL